MEPSLVYYDELKRLLILLDFIYFLESMLFNYIPIVTYRGLLIIIFLKEIYLICYCLDLKTLNSLI